MPVHPVVMRTYALRSAQMWVGMRAMAAVYLAFNNAPAFPRSPGALIFFVLVTVAVCIAEMQLRRERMLIGNLGMSPWTLGGISAIPPLLAEACIVATAALLP